MNDENFLKALTRECMSAHLLWRQLESLKTRFMIDNAISQEQAKEWGVHIDSDSKAMRHG